MKTYIKVMLLDDSGEKFFGEGPYRLMKSIEETGSMRASALSMNMAYTKALKIMKRAEDVLGFPLTCRTVGGASGGGSILTEKGKEWLDRYEAYRAACIEADQKLFDKFFSEQR